MMTWSCKTTPSGAAAFLMSWVTAMSALDGVGLPEGWLCTRISAEAPEFERPLDDLARIDRGVVDRALLLALVLDQHVLAVEKQDVKLLDLAVRGFLAVQ